MIVFYYDKEKAEQGIRFCLGQEDKILTEKEIKEQGKEELYANAVTYSSENNIPLTGYPIVEGTTVRNATIKELLDLKIMQLEEGEILVGDNEIKKIPQPSWQYKWISPNWIIDESKLQDREVIYKGEIIHLEEGWYLENAKLIKVERPLDMLKPIFNEKLHIWYEGTTHDEFVKMRTDKILEYSQLEEDKKALENSKFSTQEEIQLITEKMQELEVEINKIADKVKSL